MREKSDGHVSGFYYDISGVNYLNGDTGAAMQSFEPSAVQEGVLEFLVDCQSVLVAHSLSKGPVS